MLIFEPYARTDGKFRGYVNFVLAKKAYILHGSIPQRIAERLCIAIPVLAVYGIAEIEREGIDVRIGEGAELVRALDIVVFGMPPVHAEFKGVSAERQRVRIRKLEAELTRMESRIGRCVADVAETARGDREGRRSSGGFQVGAVGIVLAILEHAEAEFIDRVGAD